MRSTDHAYGLTIFADLILNYGIGHTDPVANVHAAESAQQLEALGQETLFGRAGQPAELAPAYVLLASSEGSDMFGNVVAVTGGVPVS